MRGVVGCSVGTGWAVLVSVADDAGPGSLTDGVTGVVVVDRRRVDLVPGPRRFVYHDAAARPLAQAEESVRRVRDEATACAVRHVGEATLAAEAARARLEVAVIVGAAPAPAGPLAKIVGSHTAIHTAEGNLYRSVLADAFATAGIPAVAVPRRDLAARTAEATEREPAAIDTALRELGRQMGPPWRKEQKDATLAAWWLLATRPR